MYSCKKNFIERTIKIVQEYQQDKEITLLINCMLGLLVFAKEKEYTISSTDYSNWGIKPEYIDSQYNNGKEMSIKNVIRHLRNSVCHCNFELKDKIGANKITHVIFKDFPKGNTTKGQNFYAEFPTNELKVFLLKLANSVLDNY